MAEHMMTARSLQLERVKERVRPLLRFWQKMSNDWVFNLSGLLAYNILMTIFPILLALLAFAGFVLSSISPSSQQALVEAIADALPGGSAGTGGVVVEVVLNNLRRQAGGIFIIALLVSVFTGSRLFVTLENCFGLIFRLRGRGMLRQNLMAIGMLLLFVVLAPILFLASFVPQTIINAIANSNDGEVVNGLLIHLIGLAVAFLVALLLFSAIYVVVPNRRARFGEVWRGTLLAAGLLVLFQLIFPIYETLALRPDNYGSVAAFAIVILLYFYYLAFILLLGGEVNSWASGQRETAGDIAAILHEVQAHNTTLGAAGPTAGMPQEDKQHHQGARAMATPERAHQHEHGDHHSDVHPAIKLPDDEKQP